jgi:WD40 repeat protein
LFSGSGLTDAGTFDLGAGPGSRNVFDIDWSPDGKFLALGVSVSPQLRVIEHNDTTFSAEIAAFAHGENVNDVSWSSDSRYLAMGGVTSGGFTTHIFDFSFSSTASAVLTPLASYDHGATVSAVSFSPDIRFLAQGGASSGGVTLRALSFNGSTLTASPSTNIATGATVNAVDWASDGRYLVSGQTTGGGAEVRTFSFEGTTLVPDQTFTHGATVNSVHWSPDGRSIAFVGAVSTTELKEVSALQFAERCTIRGNKISTILGGPLNFGLGRGRGLSASTSENLIIQNSVFNTDINYHFVNNTFRLYLTNVQHTQPSTIANLSFPPL